MSPSWSSPPALPAAVLLLFAAAVVFLAARLPQLARYLGKGITAFRHGLEWEAAQWDGPRVRAVLALLGACALGGLVLALFAWS
jgi:hypothetical protein